MLFNSLVFLFIFLPTLLLLYYLLPKKFRNALLLLSSLIFYAWGGVSYCLILILSMVFNFLFAKMIGRTHRHRKKWLITGLTFNVIAIVIFKYLDFFIENINETVFLFSDKHTPIPLKHIVLPLGISFFTFQQMSLLWDIYRNEHEQKTRFLNTALYISFFPQLIAGPIVRYNDIVSQIRNRTESIVLFRSGVRRFILGLFKKVIIANGVAQIADNIMDSSMENIDTPTAWLGIIAYAFQIYFDFSGYSDMAIGLGRMFGFKILENFNFPYISKSIKEFWRRWHISLSTWFRDYVYIPLGGNRVSIRRMYVNLMVVFLLTGFWHGATWSFVFWGIFHGTFLIIERIGFGKFLEKIPSIFSWMYAMLVLLVGWVFFRIEDFNIAFQYIGKMFGIGQSNDVYWLSHINNENIWIIFIAILSSSTFFMKAKDFVLDKIKNKSLLINILYDIILIGMFLLSITYINSNSYSPFIYFRF